MKLLKTALSALTLATLTACSHDNPMKVMPSDDVGKFLANASWHAECAQQVKNAPGYYYEKCLMQEKTSNLNCAALYQHMLDDAAKTTQFRTITLADLRDVAFFYTVKEDYHAGAFNINPEQCHE